MAAATAAVVRAAARTGRTSSSASKRAALRAPSSPLSSLLTAPSRVAHALEWNKGSGSLLGLSIGRNRIDAAVASHPSSSSFDSNHSTSILSLPSIPILLENVCQDGNEFDDTTCGLSLSSRVEDEMSAALREFDVCGLVIGWPVQKQGWCGAACGRVLFTLDRLSTTPSSGGGNRNSNNGSSSNKRLPACLWENNSHLHDDYHEDQWGRTPVFVGKQQGDDDASACNAVHVASREQYYKEPECPASEILMDFFRAHWPEELLYQDDFLAQLSSPPTPPSTKTSSMSRQKKTKKKRSLLIVPENDCFDDEDSYAAETAI